MLKEITIRYASKENAEQIADFSRQAFYDTFAPLNTKENMEIFMSKQFARQSLIEEVNAGKSIFLMAFVDKELAGYAQMRQGEQYPDFRGLPAVEIARIYASQQQVGKGIGRALMERCIEIAKDMHKNIIWLGVWEHNERALAFYYKWGFEKFGEHPFILGLDVQTDWLLKKDIY